MNRLFLNLMHLFGNAALTAAQTAATTTIQTATAEVTEKANQAAASTAASVVQSTLRDAISQIDPNANHAQSWTSEELQAAAAAYATPAATTAHLPPEDLALLATAFTSGVSWALNHQNNTIAMIHNTIVANGSGSVVEAPNEPTAANVASTLGQAANTLAVGAAEAAATSAGGPLAGAVAGAVAGEVLGKVEDEIGKKL